MLSTTNNTPVEVIMDKVDSIAATAVGTRFTSVEGIIHIETRKVEGDYTGKPFWTTKTSHSKKAIEIIVWGELTCCSEQNPHDRYTCHTFTTSAGDVVALIHARHPFGPSMWKVTATVNGKWIGTYAVLAATKLQAFQVAADMPQHIAKQDLRLEVAHQPA